MAESTKPGSVVTDSPVPTPPPSLGRAGEHHPGRSLLWAPILLLVLAALAAGCALARPIPQVVSSDIREGVSDAGDYIVWVDCVIKNRGPGSGEVRVVVTIRNDRGDRWTKEDAVYLSGRTEELKQREITIAFPEIDSHPAGLSAFQHTCGSEPTGTPFPDVTPTSNP